MAEKEQNKGPEEVEWRAKRNGEEDRERDSGKIGKKTTVPKWPL